MQKAQKSARFVSNAALKILKFPGFADSFRMTISTGITTYQPVESIDELIARSDSAMYKAKSMGRNRVVIEHLEE